MGVEEAQGALTGVRVVDLTGQMGGYCGKLFAQLGADVIMVEPLSGNEYRKSKPLAKSSGLSLAFAYDNTDKRSAALDTAVPEAVAVIEDLIASADIVLDDCSVIDLQGLGVDINAMRERRRELIYTSITPFGLDGPYLDYASSDLVCLALGGMLWLGGYVDGEPVQAAGHQAFRAGSLFAAVATAAGLLSLDSGLRGQDIDVSIQECVSLGMENAIQFYDLEGHIRRRFGGEQKQAGFGTFPAKDGYIFLIAGGIGGNRFWPNLANWVSEHQIPGHKELHDPKWGDRSYIETAAAKDRFNEIFSQLSSQMTKAELMAAGYEKNFPIAAIQTPSEVYGSRQLHARDFFAPTTVGGVQTWMPGAPYKLSETPWKHQNEAPSIGQHTGEILESIGYDDQKITTLKEGGIIR